MRTPAPLVARLALVVAAAIAPLALLASVASVLPVHGLKAIAVAFVAVTASIVAATSLLPYEALRTLRAGLATVVVGGVCMAAGLALARLGRGATATEIASGLVGSAGVVLAAGAIGAFVGSRVAHPGHLVAVALASSAADVWSVHAPEGVTRSLVETPDIALQRLFAMSAAVAPSTTPEAIIGAGDVLFASLYLAAAARHGLSSRRISVAVAIGLLSAGGMTFVLHRALPALPFVGAAVLVADRRARTVAKGDRWPTAIAGGILLASLARVALR